MRSKEQLAAVDIKRLESGLVCKVGGVTAWEDSQQGGEGRSSWQR